MRNRDSIENKKAALIQTRLTLKPTPFVVKGNASIESLKVRNKGLLRSALRGVKILKIPDV